MRVSARRLALLSVLVGVASAGAPPVRGLAQEGPAGPSVDVSVQNRSDTAARVYVLQKGHMVPVGLVEGGAAETLALPPLFAETEEPIQLIADLLGRTGWYKSEPVPLGPAGTLEMVIESDPARSVVTTR